MDQLQPHPAVVELDIPVPDPEVGARLDELLPGNGRPGDRLGRLRDTVRLGPDDALEVGGRLLDLLRARSTEDLDLGDVGSVAVEVAPLGGARPGYRVASDGAVTLVALDGGRSWPVDELVEILTREAYPGRHLARLCRPSMPAMEPSPESTVLRGLELVGREVLLGDHELAFELDRLGRRIGARWDAGRLLAVRAALEALVPHVVDRGTSAVHDAGLELDDLYPTRWEWSDAGVAWMVRAGAPPLIREWLTAVGQTEGLRRLVSEPLVPEQLRRELVVPS